MERLTVDPKRPLTEYPRIARSINPDDLLAGRGMLANRPNVTRDILSIRDN